MPGFVRTRGSQPIKFKLVCLGWRFLISCGGHGQKIKHR